MKEPHLLQVEAPGTAFGPLIEAARDAGLRMGWLDLHYAGLLPPDLEGVAEMGVLRAVGVQPGGTVTVKPVRGEVHLRDLLREHFLGCAAVLVRGPVEAPRLAPSGEAWEVTPREGDPLLLTTAELVAALRKPANRPTWPR